MEASPKMGVMRKDYLKTIRRSITLCQSTNTRTLSKDAVSILDSALRERRGERLLSLAGYTCLPDISLLKKLPLASRCDLTFASWFQEQ